MAAPLSDARFFASTRGQIITLLRRESRTINELAVALDITDNAVRAQLAILERDGLVQQSGLRRGAGKPAYCYELTPDAERLYPKAHELVLRQLLATLKERTEREEVEEVMRAVGRRIAAEHRLPGGDVRSRLEVTTRVLNDLGGLVQLEADESSISFCGYSCPLSDLAATHPEACKMMEALLTEMVGLRVYERCQHSETSQCWLEVSMS